ncbi:MAG: histidine--tRNA ligase, partial [Ruminococcus sp.]|nr:histidine--tRNA ligase [Ruminococcus sp.]
KIGAAFTVVIGDNELAEGKAMLKNMDSGEDVPVPLNDKFTANFDSVFIDRMMASFDTGDMPLPMFQTNGENN